MAQAGGNVQAAWAKSYQTSLNRRHPEDGLSN
jgi:hypothetical protein